MEALILKSKRVVRVRTKEDFGMRENILYNKIVVTNEMLQALGEDRASKAILDYYLQAMKNEIESLLVTSVEEDFKTNSQIYTSELAILHVDEYKRLKMIENEHEKCSTEDEKQEMKKVYVVTYHIDHETHGIEEIFSNEEAANGYINHLKNVLHSVDFQDQNLNIYIYNLYDDYMSAIYSEGEDE